MYLKRIPGIIRYIFSSALWKVNTPEKELYLSFDDGPNPEVTPWILELLKKHNAKATFFLRGDNAEKYHFLLKQIMQEGHSIGNHSYSHEDGWNTNNSEYFKSIEKASGIIKSKLFRPPYGRLKLSQYIKLKKDYTIVMYHLLPGDYDYKVSKEECLKTLVNKSKKGSIIALHDYERSFEKLKYCLPVYLEEKTKQGYVFKSL